MAVTAVLALLESEGVPYPSHPVASRHQRSVGTTLLSGFRRVLFLLLASFPALYDGYAHAQDVNRSTAAELTIDGEFVVIRQNPKDILLTPHSSIDLQLLAADESGMTVAATRLDRHRSIARYEKSRNYCDRIKARDPSILACSPNFLRRRLLSPSDSFYSYQWPLAASSNFGINAPHAWELSTGSQAVVIGIVDGGIDYLHEDLKDNVWTNPSEIAGDGLDNDQNGYIDDLHGINTVTGVGDPYSSDPHGTHVAGIIGATGNNGIGVTGVNWAVSILAVNAADDEGYFSSFDIVAGLEYLRKQKLERGTNIVAVNASLGGFSFSEIEYQAIQRLGQAGILFVTAAGNESMNIDRRPVYPAAYLLDNIVSVLATTDSGSRAFFSNYGFISTDIAAPGVEILSTFPDNSYGHLDGTSMAAPLVAGALALGASVRPDLHGKELRAMLFNSARPISGLGQITSTGRLLDVGHFVESLSQLDNGTASSDDSILRSVPFDVAFKRASGRTALKVRAGAPLFIELGTPLAMTNAGAATIYLHFGINSTSCPSPIKISDIRTSRFDVAGRTPTNPLIRSLTVRVLNGEGELVSRKRLTITRPRHSAPAVSTQQRVVNSACARIIESLRLEQ